MGQYGFKLLEIQVYRGQGRTPLDFGDTDGEHYLDRVVADIEAALVAREAVADDEEDEVTIGSDDVVADEGDAGGIAGTQKALAVVRVDSAVRYHSAVLLETVYGIVGDHSRGIDPEGINPDTDLTKLATTRPYRALLIAPAHGTNGFLAVEVISRAHAGGRLPSRLHQAVRGHNFKIRTFGAVADDASVADLMNGARIPEVKLFKTVSSEDSATARTMKAVVTISIGKGSPEEDSLRSKLLPWLPTKANKAKAEKPDPAHEAHELATWLWPAVDDVDFENAEVLVEGHNRRKRLQPLDMKEGFTYDIGDVSPSDEAFIAHVRDVVDRIAGTSQVDLDDDWSSPLARQ